VTTQLIEKPAAREATATLYDRHYRRIRGYCLGQLRDCEEANDAVQATFLYAFSSLQRGVEPREELPWLFTIAHNVCRTRRRSLRRRSRLEADVDLDSVCDTIGRDDPSRDDLEALGTSLAALPESQRRAFLLREWQGLSYAEVGARMGLTESAVEAVLFRARRNLAQKLRATDRVASAGALIAGGFRRFGSLAWFGKGAGVATTLALGVAAGTVIPPLVEPSHRARPAPSPNVRIAGAAHTDAARVVAGPRHAFHLPLVVVGARPGDRPRTAGTTYAAATRTVPVSSAPAPAPQPAAAPQPAQDPQASPAAAAPAPDEARSDDPPASAGTDAQRQANVLSPRAAGGVVPAAPATTNPDTSAVPPPLQSVLADVPLPDPSSSVPQVPSVPSVQVDAPSVTTPSLPDVPGLPPLPTVTTPAVTTPAVPALPPLPPSPLSDSSPQGTPPQAP
jgi:RNA polymerase sigma-70 factor (ECF subfamily)